MDGDTNRMQTKQVRWVILANSLSSSARFSAFRCAMPGTPIDRIISIELFRQPQGALKRNQAEVLEQYLHSDKYEYDTACDGGTLLAFRAKDVPDPNSYEAEGERGDADHTRGHGDVHA